MKKKFSLVLCMILCLSLLAACGQTPAAPSSTPAPAGTNDPAPGPAAPEGPALDISHRTIRFSTTSAEGTEIVNTMYDFAERVSDASDGMMKVEIYPGSQLGDVGVTLQNAQLGVQEMAVTSAANLASAGASDYTVLALPYLFRDTDHLMAVCNGQVGQTILNSTAASGTKVVGIGFWSEGFRHFFSTKPIRTLDDIAGMKLRVQPLDIDTDMCAALGASPSPIAFGELYSALQTGVVDGAENPLSGIYSNKFQEVCHYVTLDGHTCPPVVIIFSEAIWNTYSTDEQQIIMDSWSAASAHNPEYLRSVQEDYIKRFEEAGCEVIEPSDKEAWSAAMAPVYEKYGADVTGLIDAITAVK